MAIDPVNEESLARQRRLDHVCAQVEAVWKSGTAPRLSEFADHVPPPERNDLLRELLAIDEHYRRRAGEKPTASDYLNDVPECAATIRAYFAARADTPLECDVTSSPRLDLPRVPGYTIERELGRGGMGVVYLAMQERPRRRLVLKMIRDGALAHPHVRRRFHTEAEAIARLQHPNIVQVYSVGEHDGRPFMALEYVAGGGLDRIINGRPLPLPSVVEFVEQLARTVHFAHTQGVIHRDLKPANILLIEQTPSPTLADRTLSAKIADFGLAKLLEGDGSATLTKTGEALGTPTYMAPEQVRGQHTEVGPATDVYALGSILFELLTGRPPFEGATAMSTMDQIIRLDPVPPRRLYPQISRDLETICLKCLEKKPANRYPSADTLADDLRRVIRGEPILARPISTSERGVRWCRRHPTAAALMATLGIGLIGSVVALVRLNQARHGEQLARQRADANFEQAQNTIRRSLVFLAEDQEMHRRGLFEMRLRLLSAITEQAEKIRSQSSDASLMAKELAAAHLQIGIVQQHLGQLTQTAQSLDRAITLYQMLADRQPADFAIRHGLAECFATRGYFWRNSYDYDLARADYDVAQLMFQRIIHDFPNEVSPRNCLAQTWIRWGELNQHVKKFREAQDHSEVALTTVAETLKIEPTNFLARVHEAMALNGISDALARQGHLEKAMERSGIAVAKLESLSEERPDDVGIRFDIASIHLKMSRSSNDTAAIEKAESHAQKALYFSERLNSESPHSALYRLQLAQVYRQIARGCRMRGSAADEEMAERKTREQVEQLLRIGPVTLSSQHRTIVVTLYRYHIEYLIRAGRLDQALTCLSRTEEVNDAVFGEGQYRHHRGYRAGEIELTRAKIYDSLGRHPEALASVHRADQLIDPRDFVTERKIARSLALAGIGQVDSAVSGVQDTIGDTSLDEVRHFDLARVFARCAKQNATRAPEWNQQALDCLKRAQDKPLFRAPDWAKQLAENSDLSELRKLPDYLAVALTH